MRVLMFGWEFPPHITGGLGTACHGLSMSLAPMTEGITFVLPKVKGPADAGSVHVMGVSEVARIAPTLPEPDPETTHGVRFVPIPSSLRPYATEQEYRRWIDIIERRRREAAPVGDGGSVLELSGDYGKDLFDEVGRYAAVAGRAVLAEPYDVIHAHDWMTFLAGIEAKRLSGLPFIAHVHALEFDRAGENVNQSIFDLERLGMEAADRVVCVSEKTRDTAVARYGIDPAKTRVVHNGILPDPSKGAAYRTERGLPGKLVVFLGRVTMQKGPEYFLEAARLVADRVKDVRFVMAGSGDMLPDMIHKMAAYDLVDRFHFTGFIGAKQRDALLRQADLLVMSSVSEPFGLVPLEAMQWGVPVIVTHQSGVAEVLQHAIKVDFWDVRRMAEAMVHVLTEEGLHRQLVQGGEEDLAALDWAHAAAKIRNVYHEVV